MKLTMDAKTVSVVVAAAAAALIATATPAAADPAPEPPPVPVEADGPARTVTNSAAEPTSAAEPASAAEPPVEGIPHLLSLDNLPPGTSDVPTSESQPRLTYLRDLWHAMRTQEVSAGDALLLLTQRPMVADATPPQGLPAGPQAPLPAAPTAPVPPTASESQELN